LFENGAVANTLLMSGFDMRVVELPPSARVLRAPKALTPLGDFSAAASSALERPLDATPLADQLQPGSRVTVVLDDFSLPVPPMVRDCRREMLDVVLRTLSSRGVRPSRLTLVVANGLSRQWREAELTEMVGAREVPIQSHDAEAGGRLVRLGEVNGAPVEVNRALVECDLVVHLNVVSIPLMAGLFGIVTGLSGYRTLRALGDPKLLLADEAPLLPGSAYHRAHEEVGALIESRTRIFQLSAVLNNALWDPAFTAILQGAQGLSRPLQMWNALPAAVRHRAARIMKASYRPIGVSAGAPKSVAPKALQMFWAQNEVAAGPQADIVVFGLPGTGPASVRTAQNPVLASTLALGYVANLFSKKPLLKTGGVLIFANPLEPTFDRLHAPHQEFYEKVLRIERDPQGIHERFEPYFAGRPEFVGGYEQRFAFHGTHPLYAWYLCEPIRRRAAKVIVAHGDPRACARFGFMPANDVEDALKKAREALGLSEPSVAFIELPPASWVKVT
jgi:lactate racemase